MENPLNHRNRELNTGQQKLGWLSFASVMAACPGCFGFAFQAIFSRSGKAGSCPGLLSPLEGLGGALQRLPRCHASSAWTQRAGARGSLGDCASRAPRRGGAEAEKDHPPISQASLELIFHPLTPSLTLPFFFLFLLNSLSLMKGNLYIFAKDEIRVFSMSYH